MSFGNYETQPSGNFNSEFVINTYINMPSNYKKQCQSATATITVEETDDLVNSTQFKLVDTDGTNHTFTIITGNDVVTNNNIGMGYAISESDCVEAAGQVALAISDPTSTTYGKISASTNATCVVAITQALGPCASGNQNNNIFTANGNGISLTNFSGGANTITAVPFFLGMRGPVSLRKNKAYIATVSDPSNITGSS